VELGTVDDIFYRPSHPYTRGLLSSMPRVDRRVENERLLGIKGQPPSLIFLPSGCTFHPRCPYSDIDGLCTHAVPERMVVAGDHTANCHYATTLDEREVHA
jgi:peptide/nickel transport system ATP-binding protein